MSDQLSWRPLPVSAAGIPSLLISSTFTSQSYTVHVTDLANVWTESMDRKSLVRRGLERDISIDLTDGADQIRRMLDYLRAAFDPNDPENKNTSLGLSIGDEGNESLVVQIICILPKVLNLKPLEWPMILKKSPHSAIASAVVLPLVQAHQRQTRDTEMLVSALREKDIVITRLLDKLEATGTGLEHVFAALGGKRKLSKEVAEQRVKGLAAFSESKFKASRTNTGEDDLADIATLLDTVFGGEGLKSSADITKSVVPDGWWKKLGNGHNVTLVDRGKEKPLESIQPTREAEPDGTDDDDDFQVQSSPPARGRRRGGPPDPVSRPPPPDDSETSDDDPDDLDSQPARPSQPVVGNTSRIGAIGGKKQTAVPPPPRQPTPTSASPKKPVQDDSETASDSDEEKTSTPPAPIGTRPSAKPARGGIGRIGGIGTIGGKPQQQAQPTAEVSHPSTEEEARGRTRKASEEQAETKQEGKKPSPRETSTERADRKRRELRQEREARAAAGPAKKKRKF